MSFSDESHCEHHKKNCCFWMWLCGQCCYITCPPVPELIARKLAFHPPKRGMCYDLWLNEEDRIATSVKECVDKEFSVNLKNFTNSVYFNFELKLKGFTVITEKRNILVGIHHVPQSRLIENSRVKDQVIIFAQPNSSDLGSLLNPISGQFLSMMEMIGTDFYVFDYSGYGYSTGAPSESNMYSDIEAVYKYVRSEQPDKSIVLLGYSIGTAAVIDLAATKPCMLAGVVLIAPFTSGIRLFTQQPERSEKLVLDRFVSIDKADQIDVPVLICHGTNDQVVPHEHGRVIYDRLSKAVPPLLAHGADHQNILSLDITPRRIRRFLRYETELQEDGTVMELDEILRTFV